MESPRKEFTFEFPRLAIDIKYFSEPVVGVPFGRTPI